MRRTDDLHEESRTEHKKLTSPKHSLYGLHHVFQYGLPITHSYMTSRRPRMNSQASASTVQLVQMIDLDGINEDPGTRFLSTLSTGADVHVSIEGLIS